MAALVAAIDVYGFRTDAEKVVDGRDKRGHDDVG
jgi:hypothetical protein